MPITISARIPSETAERLRRQAEQEDRSVSELVNRAVDEHLRGLRFPGIWFVTGGSGRRKAKIAGGPDVWSVILAARGQGMDPDRTADYLEIPPASVRLALAYYRTYPEEIDRWLRSLDHLDDDLATCATLRVLKLPPDDDAAPA